MSKKNRVTLFVVALSLILIGFQSSAQKKTSFLQLFGGIKSKGKNLDSARVQVFENGMVLQNVTVKENGDFDMVLDLNKTVRVVFSRPGYVSKTVEVSTIVPPEAIDFGYQKKFNMDLFQDIVGVSKADPMSKPVAKIAYVPSIEDFEFDFNYSKQIQQEQQNALKRAQDQKALQDKARLDSLNKAWSDSIANAKQLDSKLAAEKAAAAAADKARQDSILRADAEKKRIEDLAKQKAREDSISQAQAEAKRKQEEERQKLLAEQREKARLDSISKAEADAKRMAEVLRERAVNDSLAKVKAEEAARQKAISDSIAMVRAAEQQARQKAAADSLMNAQALEKARRDSVAKAEAETARLADIARQKAIQDSIIQAKAIADARQKAKQDSIEKARQDEALHQKLLAEAREKAVQDSIVRAREEDARKKAEAEALVREQVAKQLREKATADSLAKANAEVKALADLKARQKAEEDKKLKEEQDKRTRDSVAAAIKLEKEKADAERQAKALAEIQARKDAMAKDFKKDTTASSSKTAIPKIRESDYQDGITVETITEPNRNIYRTVVKKEGVTSNYQKIAYGWGGVFYFKNETSVSQNTFDLEINNAKKAMEK